MRRFTNFILWKEKLPKGYKWSGERLRKIQTTTKPDHVWPEVWSKIGTAAHNREKPKNGQFLKHECENGVEGRHQKWVSSGGTAGQPLVVFICSSPWVSAVIRVLCWSRFLFPLCKLWCKFGIQWLFKHCCLFLAQVATEATFTIVRESALWYLFGVELRAVGTVRAEQWSGIPAAAIFGNVWYGQNERSGIRRGSQVLSPAIDFEDSFDSHHACSTLPKSWTTLQTAALRLSLQTATCIQICF